MLMNTFKLAWAKACEMNKNKHEPKNSVESWPSEHSGMSAHTHHLSLPRRASVSGHRMVRPTREKISTNSFLFAAQMCRLSSITRMRDILLSKRYFWGALHDRHSAI